MPGALPHKAPCALAAPGPGFRQQCSGSLTGPACVVLMSLSLLLLSAR
jgi:hypothetical protein